MSIVSIVKEMDNSAEECYNSAYLRVFNKLEIKKVSSKLFLSEEQLEKIHDNDIIIDYRDVDQTYYKLVDRNTGEIEKTSIYKNNKIRLDDILKIYTFSIMEDHINTRIKDQYIRDLTFQEFNDIYDMDFLQLFKEVAFSRLISIFNIVDINDKKNIRRYDPFYDTIIINNCENMMNINIKRDSKEYEYKGLTVNHIYVEFKYKDILLCKYDVPCVVDDNEMADKLIHKDIKIGDYLSNFVTHILGTGNVDLNPIKYHNASFEVTGSVDYWIKEILLLRLLQV